MLKQMHRIHQRNTDNGEQVTHNKSAVSLVVL